MSCSCHINPPCSYCVETYECQKCGEIKHPDDSPIEEGELCSECFEKTQEPPRCKHGVRAVDRCWECDPNIGQVKPEGEL
jgi:hypothetical protein